MTNIRDSLIIPDNSRPIGLHIILFMSKEKNIGLAVLGGILACSTVAFIATEIDKAVECSNCKDKRATEIASGVATVFAAETASAIRSTPTFVWTAIGEPFTDTPPPPTKTPQPTVTPQSTETPPPPPIIIKQNDKDHPPVPEGYVCIGDATLVKGNEKIELNDSVQNTGLIVKVDVEAAKLIYPYTDGKCFWGGGTRGMEDLAIQYQNEMLASPNACVRKCSHVDILRLSEEKKQNGKPIGQTDRPKHTTLNGEIYKGGKITGKPEIEAKAFNRNIRI